MKIKYSIVVLFACVTLVSCGKNTVHEGIVYEATTSAEMLDTNSKNTATTIQLEKSKSHEISGTDSKDVSKNIQPKKTESKKPKSEKSKSEKSNSKNSADSKTLTTEEVKKIISCSIQLAKDTNKFETSEGNIDENVDEYMSDVTLYVNSVVNESLDLSSIGSENIDVEGLTSFVHSVVKTALSESSLDLTKDDLITKNNSIPESEYNIDLLYEAALSNNQDLVLKIILSNKVDINTKTSEGKYVLEAALIFGNCEMASLLLQAEANPYLLTSDGISFYDEVMDDGSTKMKKIFSNYCRE